MPFFFPSIQELCVRSPRRHCFRSEALKAHRYINTAGFIILSTLKGWKGLLNYFSGKQAFFLLPLESLEGRELERALLFLKKCPSKKVNVGVLSEDRGLTEFEAYHILKYLSKNPAFALAMVKKLKERIKA